MHDYFSNWKQRNQQEVLPFVSLERNIASSHIFCRYLLIFIELQPEIERENGAHTAFSGLLHTNKSLDSKQFTLNTKTRVIIAAYFLAQIRSVEKQNGRKMRAVAQLDSIVQMKSDRNLKCIERTLSSQPSEQSEKNDNRCGVKRC